MPRHGLDDEGELGLPLRQGENPYRGGCCKFLMLLLAPLVSFFSLSLMAIAFSKGKLFTERGEAITAFFLVVPVTAFAFLYACYRLYCKQDYYESCLPLKPGYLQLREGEVIRLHEIYRPRLLGSVRGLDNDLDSDDSDASMIIHDDPALVGKRCAIM